MIKKIHLVDKLIFSFFTLLLILMINFPTMYKEVKLIPLSILIMFIFYRFTSYACSIYINKDILFLFLLNMFTGVFFILYGVINSAPGAIRVSTVMVLWPTLWILIIASIDNISILGKIHKIFMGSLVFIVSYAYLFFFNKVGILPDSFFIDIYTKSHNAVGFYGNYFELSLLVFASLFFLIPYYFSTMMLKRKIGVFKLFLFFLCLFLVFMSGRKALLFISLFSIFLLYFLIYFLRCKEIKSVFYKNWRMLYKLIPLLIFFFVVLSLYTSISFDKLMEVYINAFNFSDASGNMGIRYIQFRALLEGWMESPLFGHGLGSVASIVRSDEMPWSYELTYLALLFQVGMVGVIIYGFSVLWIFWQLIIIIKGENSQFIKITIPVFVGTLSFLIANATNPYLYKFDLMWVLFIPILIINLYKLDGKRSKN